MPDLFWLFQAIVSAFLAATFAWYGFAVFRKRRRSTSQTRERLEHSVVVAATLVLIAAGNVVTSGSYAFDLDPNIRNGGGILVRFALFICAVYLIAAGPELRQVAPPTASGNGDDAEDSLS